VTRRTFQTLLVFALLLAVAGWWIFFASSATPSGEPEEAGATATDAVAAQTGGVVDGSEKQLPPGTEPFAAPNTSGASSPANNPLPSLPVSGADSPSATTNAPTPSGVPAVSTAPAVPPPASRQTIADVLEGVDLTIPGERERVVAEMRAIEEEQQAAAVARAKELGVPLRIERPDGRIEEVAALDDRGNLLYRTTHNVAAAISTAANLLQQTPYSLSGTGLVLGVWDGGAARSTHQEFGGRVTVKDGAGSVDHATHVAGTIIASGVDVRAKGMATSARVDSYNWTSDTTEMTAAAAVAATETNKVLISNHSYGFIAGWNYVNGGSPYRLWEWVGWGGTNASSSDPGFGQYDSTASSWDSIAATAPYYAIFKSAGNDRNNDPASGAAVSLTRGGSTVTTYNSSIHPAGDGVFRGGYETIGYNGVAKNIITIGAVHDATNSSGVRVVGNATNTSFTSWGPTDDGRIKPDLVANGQSLLSSINSSNSAYGFSSGTSMSSPNAAGTAALVMQEYIRLFGGAMRSSTVKGLLIHTADDLQAAGPDYMTGWGLVNGKAAADLVRDHAANPAKTRLTEGLISTSSNTITHTFTWDGVSPIRATLCWTDPAGSSTTATDSRTARLVNNLDLRVVGPNSVTNRPFVMPFVGNWTQASMSLPAATGTNNTDNVEQVHIASPSTAGTYQAVVTYQGILSGNQQHFSLLISGSGEVPSSVTGLSAIKLSSTSIRLSWSAVADAMSYKVQRDGVQIATVSSATSFTDTGLSPSTDYAYRVVAANAAGDAVASAPASARTGDWIDDSPLALLVLTPQSPLTESNSVFLFAGQAGSGLTNGITWSNALNGQTGFFGRARDWSHEIPLAIGTNVITFRAAYELYQTNLAGWDDAGWAAYSGGWSSGLNGGSGFGPWSLGATGSAGHFIASAWANTNLGRINGFGLWANSGGVATAARSFGSALQVRSRFSMFFDNNWITENGNSSVGFALTDAANNSRFAFFFTGGQANYRIQDATATRDTGIGWTDAGFTLTFELTGADSYSLTVGTNSFAGTLASGGDLSRLVISNNNAGPDEAYNFYIGDLMLHTVNDLSGVAEVTAPAVVRPDMMLKTDGIPDSWWQLYQIGAADRVAAGDFDADGLSNAMEYFTGQDPTVNDAAGAMVQGVGVDEIYLDYRRSKEVHGITGAVFWSTHPDGAAGWLAEGVTDVVLQDHGTWELRRASVPWLSESEHIFLRLDLTME
jgi:hypothetical protein